MVVAMPACTNESLSQLWKSNGDVMMNGSLSTSPPISSNCSTLVASRLRRIPSNLHLAHSSRTQSPSPTPPPLEHEIEGSFFRWILYICFGLVKNVTSSIFRLIWSQLLIGPTLWITICFWISWKVISIPLNIIKWLLVVLHTPPMERARKKRTVLISGGSTVQSLHLARNFYSAGARVIVCEVEGCFGLSRYSTAVDKYYTIPKPRPEHPDEYVHALCKLVKKEHANYYIPASATNSAYYDALAKPHLEALNCHVFCPNVKEVKCLDDLYEVLCKCRQAGLPTPIYYHVISRDDIYRLYDSGVLRSGKHFMASVGTSGVKDRVRIEVPPFRQDFRTSQDISEQRPWVIVQDLPGDHFVTCTTIKDSKVVANVSCMVERDRGGLIPVENEDISNWIQMFFNKLKYKSIDGHFSFRFVISPVAATLVPLGCRVGVTLPYICYTNVHPRVVWKPCPHFSRRNSGPIVEEIPRYWMHDAVLSTLRHPTMEAVEKFIGTVLDKREALFLYWDPIPYCAYYHVQLPIRNIVQMVRGNRHVHHGHIRRTLTTPVL